MAQAVDPFADDSQPEPTSAPAETPEQVRARELEEQLAAAEEPVPPAQQYQAPVDEDGHPVPEDQLTPEQKRIRDLEHRLAVAQTRKLDSAAEELDELQEGEGVLIHIVEDGFTAQGRVWYRGQEIEFVKGSRAYNQTFGRDGHSWLELDDAAQYDRFGKIYFRRGPWPGKPWPADASGQAEAQRARRAPLLPSVGGR